MKILLLNDDFTEPRNTQFDGEPRGRGGAAVIASLLAEGYSKAGHDVSVLTTHQSGSDDIVTHTADHYTVTSLPIGYNKLFRHYLSVWNPTAVRLVKAYLREHGPFDAVHAHNVHNFLSYRSLSIIKKHTKKLIITFHDVMSVGYGRLTTKRYLDEHNPKLTLIDQLRNSGRTYNPFRNILIRMFLRTVDSRVTVSTALQDVLEKNGNRIDAVVHNGIDIAASQASPERLEELKEAWQLAGKKVLFLGGRIRGDKGVEQSLAAFAKVHKAHPDGVLLLVGDRDRAEALIAASAYGQQLRSHIVMTDWIPREDVLVALTLSRVCLTPSICFDSFPTVNLESMAVGTPVIGTCFGGTPEIVQDRETGYIVDPRDTDRFAACLQKLLADDTLAEKMGHAAKERIAREFTLEKQVQQYLSLLSSVY